MVPRFTLIAGANGCGKSTLTHWHHDFFRGSPIFDPDAISKALQVGGAGLAAGREVLIQADHHLRERRSFAIETTLSGKNYLQMMLAAKQAGFLVTLVYIGTMDVEINIARVARRVILGGHSVPEHDIRRRYERSLAHLPIAVSRADHTILLDNSGSEGYEVIAVLEVGNGEWLAAVPAWARPLRRLREP